ncbi:MAG: 3-dehydroquinate synthase family protein [Bacteroidales bacterium]
MVNNLIVCDSISDIELHLPKGRHIVTVIDSNIKALYGSYFPTPQIEVVANEEQKGMEQILALSAKLMELGADRSSFIVAVGGGITSDIVGFLASIYYRGVEFALVPTTLLAQVDASLGGKNGVNFKGYKNILGNINQPSAIFQSPHFLKSLSSEALSEGLAEMLKAFIIADRELFFKFLDFLDSTPISPHNASLLSPFIKRGAEIKLDIVTRDTYEVGERKLLNLGHTFAHAIEKRYRFSHGKAVAIGIILASKLSMKVLQTPVEEVIKIEEGVEKLGFGKLPKIEPSSLLGSIGFDKKRSREKITFALVKRVGECTLYPIEISNLKELFYDLS